MPEIIRYFKATMDKRLEVKKRGDSSKSRTSFTWAK